MKPTVSVFPIVLWSTKTNNHHRSNYLGVVFRASNARFESTKVKTFKMTGPDKTTEANAEKRLFISKNLVQRTK